MKTPFTSEEVQAAIEQLQNNKSVGRENIKAELLKYGTENIAKEIATIYNEIARTGERPKRDKSRGNNSNLGASQTKRVDSKSKTNHFTIHV